MATFFVRTVGLPLRHARRLLFRFANAFFRSFGYMLVKFRKGFHYVPDVYGKTHGKLRDIREDELFAVAAEAVVSTKKSCLNYDRLHYLYQALMNVIAKAGAEEPITVLEIGCWRGGTSYFLASLAERLLPGRVKLFSIDTFKGHSALDLPEGWEGNQEPGTFEKTDFETVRAYLAAFPFVEVIKSRIQDSAERLAGERLNLIHLDVDIREPTYFSLTFFGPRMAPGGIIVVDDYGFVTCPGVKEAVDRYRREHPAVQAFCLESGQCLLLYS